MPLKLVPPREGKSQNWTIRGSYLGVDVDESSGTHKRSVAQQALRKVESDIERASFEAKDAPTAAPGPTFVSAAVAYMEAGRRRRHVAKLIKYFGATPVSEITQQAIDKAAIDLFPNVAPASRNAYVYTPVSAILHHAGVDITVRRPKGYKGRVKTEFLMPDDAFALIAAATAIDAELGLLLSFLLYTGCRIGEALALTLTDVDLEASLARIAMSKNEDPRTMELRGDLRDALAVHLGGNRIGRVFRFQQGGHFSHQLVRARLAACGIPCPVRRPTGWRAPAHRLSWVTFHTFRHTWASWMRRYAGTDLQGLVATGNWRDPRSAARYAHVVPREEWAKVEQLPTMKIK